MTRKINACPHCGGYNVRIFSPTWADNHYVHCDDCLAKGPITAESKDRAIELWNARTEPKINVEVCHNCDTAMPVGCEGEFIREASCKLHQAVIDRRNAYLKSKRLA